MDIFIIENILQQKVRVVVGGRHQSCQCGVMVETCTCWLKLGCPMKGVTNDNKIPA